MEAKDTVKEVVKPRAQQYYMDRFFKKLSEPICVVGPLTNLCGGCTTFIIYRVFVDLQTGHQQVKQK